MNEEPGPYERSDPIGTVAEYGRTADPWPHARETIRKTYPDGTVAQWHRVRGEAWKRVQR